MPCTDLKILKEFFRKHSGYNVRDDQVHIMEAHLKPVLEKHALTCLNALSNEIRKNELSLIAQAALEAMAIHETMFFRDQKPFDVLIENVLPELLANKPKGSRVDILSAACSSGQEVYSLAMAIEQNRHKFPTIDFHITGTDISSRIVKHAKEGLYNEFEINRGLAPDLRDRYFHREGDSWRISDTLKNRTTFMAANLMNLPASLGKFDIVFCRNVLIYFAPNEKVRALTNIHKHCKKPAYLFVGGVDIVNLPDLFVPTGNHAVYTTRTS